MCGIAGIINFEGLTELNREELPKITRHLAHRGPDHQGEYYSPKVALGHRRLAIIDLTPAANQPMSDEKEQVIVVFNGEIFNHAEIRKELEHKYRFKTDHSDTEVIIYSYIEWGIDCLNKFTGQFAIAIYDKQTEEIFLARDRIGQKPIYFTQTNQGIYFASEAAALFQSTLIIKNINPTAIYDYLTYLTIKAPNTFYERVSKVEAGSYIKITSDELVKESYWDVADYLNQTSNDTEFAAISKTEHLLEKSMEYRNISDAPISFALSGGLDSSLNLYYSRNYNTNPRAINISYQSDNPYNENKIAQRFCKDQGIPLNSEIVSPDSLERNIKSYLQIQSDIPIGDPNSVLMFILAKKSKILNRNVLMVGEGGDEIGGYPKYLKHYKRYRLLNKIPRFFKAVFRNPFYDLKKLDLFYNNEIISGAHIHGFTEAEKKDFWKGPITRSSYEVLSETMNEIFIESKERYLRQITNLEYKIRLPEMILARIDYPTMASSIEARSPFVDHKLIEYSCTLPFSIKMKNGHAKNIIKKLALNKLPHYILDSPKVGFGQLLTPFLNETLPIWFKSEIIEAEEAPIKDYVAISFLENTYNQQIKYQRLGFKMWVLYALNKWLVSNQ